MNFSPSPRGRARTSETAVSPYILRLGYGIPLLFFATTIISGVILGNYNHASRMVSELGALGTSSQYVFSAGLLLCAALSVLFFTGLYRACKEIGISTIPVFILFSYSISIAGAAVFPLPLRMHLIMGMPSVLLFLSPLLGMILWGGAGQLAFIKRLALLSYLVMMLGFLAFMPDVLSDYPGVKQRIFHVGWSVWFIALSFSFVKRTSERDRKEIVR